MSLKVGSASERKSFLPISHPEYRNLLRSFLGFNLWKGCGWFFLHAHPCSLLELVMAEWGGFEPPPPQNGRTDFHRASAFQLRFPSNRFDSSLSPYLARLPLHVFNLFRFPNLCSLTSIRAHQALWEGVPRAAANELGAPGLSYLFVFGGCGENRTPVLLLSSSNCASIDGAGTIPANRRQAPRPPVHTSKVVDVAGLEPAYSCYLHWVASYPLSRLEGKHPTPS